MEGKEIEGNEILNWLFFTKELCPSVDRKRKRKRKIVVPIYRSTSSSS